jgi:hypothetical protein
VSADSNQDNRKALLRLLGEFRADPRKNARSVPVETRLRAISFKSTTHLVPFYTGGAVLDDEIGEARFNNHFNLRVYLPKKQTKLDQVFVF